MEKRQITAKDRKAGTSGLREAMIVAALSVGLFAVVALPQLRRAFPFTYDELIYMRKTRAYEAWLAEGLHRARAGQPFWLFSREALAQAEALEDMHPGFAKFVALLPNWAARLVLHREGGSRLTGALFMALGASALYLFLRPYVGRLYALTAALGLMTLPRLFAHAHFFALDVPVMAMTWTAGVLAYRAAYANRWRAALGAAIVLGLALATKHNTFALFGQLGLWLAVIRPPGAKKIVASWLLVPFVFFLLWPWLWLDPIGHFRAYIAFHGHHYSPGVTYWARTYGGATTAPWHYSFVMLALTLPTPWLVALLGGLTWMGVMLVRWWRSGRERREKEGEETEQRETQKSLMIFLALGLFGHLGLSALPSAARYGGVRLFLPVFPYVLAISVLGVKQLTARIRRRGLSAGLAVLLALCLVGDNVRGIVRIYPYCLSYYGEAIGGLRGAARAGLEITYWGDAYAGAAEFMRRHPQDRFVAAQHLATGVLDALIAAGELPPQHRLYGRFVKDHLPCDADWLIVDNHPPLWPLAVRDFVRRAKPAYVVTREGVPLLWIFPLRGAGVQGAAASPKWQKEIFLGRRKEIEADNRM